MKPHMWIAPLALVTIAGCGDDGSVVGPSSVAVRGDRRDTVGFTNRLEFVDPSKECRRHYHPIGWYPWYPPVWTCHPAR
jgi:hypothetical protein